jgi:hypothetical protein
MSSTPHAAGLDDIADKTADGKVLGYVVASDPLLSPETQDSYKDRFEEVVEGVLAVVMLKTTNIAP